MSASTATADSVQPSGQLNGHANHLRISAWRKAAYAFAGMGLSPLSGLAGGYAKIFYTRNLGLSPVLVGYAYVAIQVIDALNDIVLGQISDNTRSRWGRRRPYILIGGIACAIAYLVIWAPPSSLPPWLLAIFLAFAVGLADTANTIVSVPHAALGAELSYDYHERTSVMSYRTAGLVLGGIAGTGSFYLATLLSGGTQATQRGFLLASVLLGAFAIVCCTITFLGTREEVGAQKHAKINLIEALKYCFRNQNYVVLTLASVIAYTGGLVGLTMENYICLFHVSGGNDALAGKLFLGAGVGSAVVVFLFGLPFLNWLSRRLGKRAGMMVCIAYIGLWVFMAIPMLTPDHPWLRVVFVATYVWAIEGMVHVFTGSMVADLCDIDELATGRRREGMYMSLLPLIIKLSGAAAMLLWGLLLNWTGFVAGQATQSPETVQRLFIAMVVPTCLGPLFGLIVLLKYNVTEERIKEVRAQLDAQRADGSAIEDSAFELRG